MGKLSGLLHVCLAEWRGLASDRLFLRLVLILSLIVAVFVVAHIAFASMQQLGQDSAWHRAHIGRDRGYGERFEYLLLALTSGLLTIEALRTRRILALLAAGLFAVMLADNLLGIHEKLGHILAHELGWVSTIDQGQFVAFLAMGAAAAAAFLPALLTSDPEDGKSIAILLLVVPLGAFGVGVDTIHAWFGNEHWLDTPLTLLEDGGEMMVQSIIAAATIAFAAQRLQLERRGVSPIRRRFSPGSRPAASGPARSTRTAL